MRLEIKDSIAEIGVHDWGRLSASASLYSSYNWLEYAESHSDASVAYMVILDGETVVSALPVSTFSGEIPRFYDPSFLYGPLEKSSNTVSLMGTREGYSSEFLFREGISEDQRTQAAGMLIGAFADHCSRRSAIGGMFYLPKSGLRFLRASPEVDVDVRFMDAFARIPVKGGLANYFDGMKSKTKIKFKRERRKLHESGIEVEVARLSECADDIAGLSADALQKFGHNFSFADEKSRFLRQARHCDDMSHIVIGRVGGRVVGFAQFFSWGNALYARHFGAVSRDVIDAALYFNLVYYEGIELADSLGLSYLDLGCDTFGPKVARGAQLYSLWCGLIGQALSREEKLTLEFEEKSRKNDMANFFDISKLVT